MFGRDPVGGAEIPKLLIELARFGTSRITPTAACFPTVILGVRVCALPRLQLTPTASLLPLLLSPLFMWGTFPHIIHDGSLAVTARFGYTPID